MSTAIVTGAGGLVGSTAVRMLCENGWDVVGVENNMRAYFFGEEGSTEGVVARLLTEFGENLRVDKADIRNMLVVQKIVRRERRALDLIVHAAAQPSHDWAARKPHVDFGVNAWGTLNLLQAAREFAEDATFAHISTSKVYGDRPNKLPLVELDSRLDLPEAHPFHAGIDTSMSIDRCTHSLFGVSKAAGDLLVQEYGRYFDMPTVCLRPGCVTGAAHAGVELHGFLAYLMKCCVTGREYTVNGYGGKQVRCNIEGGDLVRACLAYHDRPTPGAVYNIGGGRHANCSMLEAIDLCEKISGKELNWSLSDTARIGDHRWWISEIDTFTRHYPDWKLNHTVESMLQEIHDRNVEQWT